LTKENKRKVILDDLMQQGFVLLYKSLLAGSAKPLFSECCCYVQVQFQNYFLLLNIKRCRNIFKRFILKSTTNNYLDSFITMFYKMFPHHGAGFSKMVGACTCKTLQKKCDTIEVTRKKKRCN
jgi:hypothetical protein